MILSQTDKVAFISSIFGSVYVGKDNNVAVKCPCCVKRDPTKKNSEKKKLLIHLDSYKSHCWVCGWSSRSLLSLVLKFGTQEQLRVYKEKFNEGLNSSKSVYVDKKTKSVLELPNDFKLVSLVNQSTKNPDIKAILNYLNNRLISDYDKWFYHLGYSNELKWYRRIIIPSYDKNGILNFYTGRTVDKNKTPKYDNCSVPKSDIIFNELNIKWTKELVICEGPFDMFKCGENSTCLLGSELNENHLLFEKIISNSTPVLLSLDQDMKDKTNRIAKKLLEYDIKVKIADLGNNHDPGSMTKNDFNQVKLLAQYWSWETSFFEKIRAL